MIEIPAAHASYAGGNSITFIIPGDYLPDLREIFSKNNVKKSGQLYIKIGPPRKPRTTGFRSQNTHIHGHATQIAEYLGEYKSIVIEQAKEIAISMGYPQREDAWGRVRPLPEEDLSTEEASILIEVLHMIASELEINLKEYGDIYQAERGV